MPKLKMTDAIIRQTTAAPGTRIDYVDAHPRDRQRGLWLRVSGHFDSEGHPAVSRAWSVLCRVKGSNKLRRFTIGDYPSFGLADARAAAADIVKQTRRDGIDPLQERKKAEAEEEAAHADTISELVPRFLTDLGRLPKKKGGLRSPRYVEETRRNFAVHVLPRWGKRNIREITRRDLNDLLDAVAFEGTDRREDGSKRRAAGGKIASNRVYASIRALFYWAINRGYIDTMPVARADARGEEIARERTLSDDEIGTVWPCFHSLGYPFAHFFCLALATGQRRSEVAGIKLADIDEAAKTWTIPKEKTKGRREHVVPLSELALAIVADAKRLAPRRPDGKAPTYLLTTRADRPISGYSKARSDLDKAIAAALKKAKRPPIEPWWTHDLRRTCASGMAALGIDQFHIGRVLNHADRSITGVYNRHSYAAEKKAALQKWGEHLAEITRPKLVGGKRTAA
jgi:integrase